MAQPYLPHFQHLNYEVGIDALLKRPKFSDWIGKCIARWSYVDNELGGLFGILIGTESQAAYRVFLVLRRWSNQRQALDAAAEGKLSGDELLLYRALLVEYGSLEGQRNDLAHGCFGICREDDDILYAIKVEHHVLWQADIIPKLGSSKIAPPDIHKGLQDKLWVYREADLKRLFDDMNRLWWDLFTLNGYLRDQKNALRVAQFRLLFDKSHIQERIAALT